MKGTNFKKIEVELQSKDSKTELDGANRQNQCLKIKKPLHIVISGNTRFWGTTLTAIYWNVFSTHE